MAPRNPFRPSFGITPTVVVGRKLVTMNVGLALLEGPGSPYRFTLVSGPRGSGKTVLLNLLEEEARHRGWTVLRVTSSHDMVDDLVATDSPRTPPRHHRKEDPTYRDRRISRRYRLSRDPG